MPADDGPADWQRIDVQVDLTRRVGNEPLEPGRKVDIVVPEQTIVPKHARPDHRVQLRDGRPGPQLRRVRDRRARAGEGQLLPELEGRRRPGPVPRVAELHGRRSPPARTCTCTTTREQPDKLAYLLTVHRASACCSSGASSAATSSIASPHPFLPATVGAAGVPLDDPADMIAWDDVRAIRPGHHRSPADDDTVVDVTWSDVDLRPARTEHVVRSHPSGGVRRHRR